MEVPLPPVGVIAAAAPLLLQPTTPTDTFECISTPPAPGVQPIPVAITVSTADTVIGPVRCRRPRANSRRPHPRRERERQRARTGQVKS